MNKEFIPHEQALELKELGFNESCIGYYRQGEVSIVFAGNYLSELELEKNFEEDGDPIFGDKGCTAPLYQQAFRWFREKYEIESLIKRHFTGSVDWCYGYEICYLPKEFQNMKRPYGNLKYIESYQEGIGSYYGGWNEYEEAELACLIKLIEIAKNK